MASIYTITFSIPAILLMVAILFIIADYRGLIKGLIYFMMLVLVTVLSGMSYMQYSSHAGQTEKFIRKHEQGKSFVLDLIEVKQGDSEWIRAVGELRFLNTVNGFIETNGRILLFLEGCGEKLTPGDRLFVASKVEPIKNKGNPGEFNAEAFWGNKRVGLISFVQSDQYKVSKGNGENAIERFTGVVRNYCIEQFEKHFEKRVAGVLTAIVLGEKSLLDEETKSSFKNTGAMHVLAVSGLHIGLILYLLMFIAEGFSAFISRRNALIVLVVFFWFYALLTGASPSVVRAVFMFSMLAFSQVLSRNYDPLNILFFTAFILLLMDPYTLFDIGFQLSYLAMLGIFLFYKPIEESIQVPGKWLKKIWQGTAIGFAAQICTTPLSLIYFNQFPNYFILSNLGLMATSGLILGIGIVFPIVSGIPVFSSLIVICLSAVVMLTLKFLSWIEDLPGAVVYGYNVSWLQLVFISLGVIILFQMIRIRNRLVLAGVLLISGIGGMSYDRFDKMAMSEVRVLNFSRPIIVVKNKGEIFCFYSIRSEDQLDKIKKMMDDYSRVYPGKLHFIELNEKSWRLTTSENNLIIEERKNAVFIKSGRRSCLIRKSNDIIPFKEDVDFTVGMPWVSLNVDHCLAEGSVRIF